jgi:DNA polymerase-4
MKNPTPLDTVQKELLALGNKTARRMRHKGLKGKTITLKVKYSDFVKITRSATLPKSTDDGVEIYSVACRLLEKTKVTKAFSPARFQTIRFDRLF